MNINNINQINFNGKVRYITPNMRASIESLLIRMNAQTHKQTIGDHFVSTIVTRLDMGKASFTDERRLLEQVPHNKQMKGFSMLDFGKTHLDIDNKTGEIIDSKKPFYKPWFFVMKQAERVLQDFRSYFYDKSVVEQKISTINTLTPEGEKNINKIVLEYEKQRLKDVINRLKQEV